MAKRCFLKTRRYAARGLLQESAGAYARYDLPHMALQEEGIHTSNHLEGSDLPVQYQ
ncbi:hypothetical protein [Taibaiella koreensis]|uniref:hypothetical protein n=1 Tax=Taibaiella koreensis TaxID=1268548 RepID=UPI0013C3568F|nr:hypothetical protein [Taibaiella koreensis]